MQTRVLKGLSKAEQDELKGQFIHSKRFRERLVSLLEGDIESLQRSMENEDVLNSVGWERSHIDRLAQIKAYKKIISVLSEKSL